MGKKEIINMIVWMYAVVAGVVMMNMIYGVATGKSFYFWASIFLIFGNMFLFGLLVLTLLKGGKNENE